MKGAIGIFSVLGFVSLGSGHADSAMDLFDINSSQKYLENIQLSFPELNDADIPAWVDEWKAPKIFQKLFPFYISGYDFDGSPVYVMEFGHWKVAEAIASYKDGPEKAFDLLIKYQDQTMYSIYRDGLANDRQGVVVILDIDGFGISSYTSQLSLTVGLRQLATLNHIKKVLNYGFFINTNFAAENLIQVARPLIGDLLDRIEIFGTQKYKWLPRLARKIPTNQLPPWLGGPQDWQPVIIGLESFDNSTAVSTT